MIYECTLPFPVSVNSAYGNRSNQKRFKSKAYKDWEKKCPNLTLPDGGSIDYPIHLVFRFYMPDKRVRDLDNYIKLPTDMLVKQCILFDDNTKVIRSVHYHFAGVDKGNPRVEVEIHKIKENVVSIA